MAAAIDVSLPARFEGLWKPFRYKVGVGGRAGLKSWTFARTLLLMASMRKLRILCTREVQESIAQSVHYLLKGQIERMGLAPWWDVQKGVIRGPRGSEFIFAGLSDQTAESLKSYEDVDIVWCEEAHAITKRSWDILIPTIRKSGSEIWISLNPELDTDETYSRFVAYPPPRTLLIYTDWSYAASLGLLSSEALEEVQTAKRTMAQADFNNIWGGQPRAAAAGAIYAGEMQTLTTQQRVQHRVDYDSGLKVHLVLDLGWADSTAVGFVQRHLSSVRFIDYMEESQRTENWLSARFREKDYNYGRMYLPHDAFHHGNDGKTPAGRWDVLGWDVVPWEEIGPMRQDVENGIKAVRDMLPRSYFDSIKCARLIECIKRYRRNIPVATGEATGPRHDAYSHGADMLRYTAVNIEHMTNDNHKRQKLTYPSLGTV